MTIFIQPDDVLFFRDARPFSAGEQGRATSIFPPTPQTLQGVLRALRLGQESAVSVGGTWTKELRNEIGMGSGGGDLHLLGPQVARWEGNTLTRYYPQPQDLIWYHEGYRLLEPKQRLVANWPEIEGVSLQPLYPKGGEATPEKSTVGWLTQEQFASYLRGNVPESKEKVTSNSDLFATEPRLGIKIDAETHATEEGKLYQSEYIRCQENVGLLVNAKGLTLKRCGPLAVGGEARAGYYQTLPQPFHPDCLPKMLPPLSETGKTRFKLYLATPALFAHGWYPDWITKSGNWNGIRPELVAAALGRSVPITSRGVSSHQGPRPLRRAVPAGSVYYFEASRQSWETIVENFHAKCLADDPEDRQIGFGLSYIGVW